MSKPRILWVGEASFLNTGYSVYGKEVLSRLHATGKYDIAELACYGEPDSVQRYDIPWTYYSNAPCPDSRDKDFSQEEHSLYQQHQTFQFGEWRFDEVCLDFKPDIVIDIRDWWMFEHEQRSAFRDMFKWMIMPTIDSAPQQEQYLDTFLDADKVFTYTEYGRDVLLDETNNRVNFAGIAPPGVSFNVFKPVKNKSEHKASVGFTDDIKIVGTVMRNQGRKLYPELFKAFSMFCQQNRELAHQTYLYCHVSYPDNGWDIPKYLRMAREYGIAHKVLFTYCCENCRFSFPSFFQDARCICPQCRSISAKLPDTRNGVSNNKLCDIYNYMDLYVTYSVCMPPEEKVLVNNQWLDIKDVKIGDVAYTHNNRWMPVTNVMSRDVDEEIFEIGICSDFAKIKLTKEHPIYAYTHDNVGRIAEQSVRETLGHRLRNKQDINNPEFVPTENLKIGDMIAYPIDDTINDKHHIDLYGHAKSTVLVGDKLKHRNTNKTHNRTIYIDNAFCRYLGLFLADGSYDNNLRYIKITCGINEVDNISLCNMIHESSFGNTSTIRKYSGREAVDVRYHSISHANFFSRFGKLTQKKLPDFVMYLPVEKQLNILQGWMMGDGHYLEEENTTISVTTSLQAAEQIKNLLRRCRINFNVRKVNKGGNRQPQYRFEIAGNGKAGKFEMNVRKSTSNLYHDNYHLLKIKNIDTINYSGKVYNFEVKEDNSYTTKIGSVHNCEGFGMPQAEAAACGVPIISVNYSAMESILTNLNGIPVKPITMFHDTGTDAERAYPDNQDFVNKLVQFFKKPSTVRQKLGRDSMLLCRKHYSFDKTAKVWETEIDKMEIGQGEQWQSKVDRTFTPNPNPPPNLTNDQFVRWATLNILGRPDKINSYLAVRALRDLNYGRAVGGTNHWYENENCYLSYNARYSPFGIAEAIQQFRNIRERANYFENRRLGKIVEEVPYFIKRAKR